MRLILDTHALLWLMQADSRLKPGARTLIHSATEVYVSSASIWEISIKHRLGKLPEDPEIIVEQLENAGMKELPVINRHAVAAGRLPLLHADPFDRLLVAQAITENMRLLTADAQLADYSALVICV
jgi:PIN domain nuclease of toxin-antitoxin system